MSLENSINELKATIDQLNKLLADMPSIMPTEHTAKPKNHEKKTPPAAKEPELVTEESLAADSEKPGNVEFTFEDVKAVFVQVSKEKGREAVVELLTRLGVSKLPELGAKLTGDALQGVYAEAIRRAQAVLDGEALQDVYAEAAGRAQAMLDGAA